MKHLLRVLPACESEPLSRQELWFAAIAVYVVLATFLVAHFTPRTGGETKTIVPVSLNA